MTALREIKLLQELQHHHVIELIDVFQHKRNLNLVRPRTRDIQNATQTHGPRLLLLQTMGLEPRAMPHISEPPHPTLYTHGVLDGLWVNPNPNS